MITKSDFNPECITFSQMKLIFNARMYYKRLTAWARAYILSRYLGVGTADELFGRLYLEALNQAEVLNIFFSREDAANYSELLGDFVVLLRNIISAQMDGDTEALARNADLMAQNIEERAAFLHSLNPYVNEKEYGDMLRAYVQNLFDLADMMATGAYDKDIEIYDSLNQLSYMIGDAFAESLYNYMTSGSDDAREGRSEDIWCIPYDQLNIVFGTKMFWFDLVIWTRNYMLSRFIGFGASDRVFDHLRHVADDFINMVGQIFGREAADAYTLAFEEYIRLIDAFVTAQMEGNVERINEIIPQLYQNAMERALIPTRDNPYWNEELWSAMIRNALRNTIAESTAFLMGDFARSLDIYSTLLNQAENMGNEFERGYLNYINSVQNIQELR